MNKIFNIKKIFLAHFKLFALTIIFFLANESKAQSLEDFQVLAAENNLELKAQYKAFEAKLEEVTQAKSWQDPNLSFGYFISPIETRVGPQIARFSLSQKLPWFGTFKAKGDVATKKAEFEYEKFQNQKMKLFLQVAKQYYDISVLRSLEKIEQQQLKVLDDLKSMIEVQYENDQAKLVDVLRIDLEIDDQKTAIQVIKDQEKAQVSKLNSILNRQLKTPIEITNPELVLEQDLMFEADSVSENHPRLQAIQRLKESNLAEAELVKKQNMPQFGFGLDYAIIQNRNVMNADAGQDAIMPMLSVSLPIFGKKNKSREKLITLQGKSVDFQLENERNLLENEIQISRYKQNELNNLLDLYNQQITTLEDILELSEAALANANMEIEEVLRLYEKQLIYKKQRIKTLAELQKINQTLRYLTSNLLP
ncbi:TolC family protein [Psychroflexus aestuariivivens]|uniref:TolC family protein n=1 Tax=Psychroflexus aestuariivivens TaxID=1795040 RepID=UPI000FDC7E8B|nr:TolC family protein [Psychroflexus aestuariivivens]